MILEVYARTTKEDLKVALESYLQCQCVKEIQEDEAKYYVTLSSNFAQFMKGVTFTHDTIQYTAFTHYI